MICYGVVWATLTETLCGGSWANHDRLLHLTTTLNMLFSITYGNFSDRITPLMNKWTNTVMDDG